jgi:hypothetical protein
MGGLQRRLGLAVRHGGLGCGVLPFRVEAA